MINEHLTLMQPKDLDRSPKIIELKKEFKDALPPHFGEPRFYPSPLESVNHVLRADCKESSCRTRATVQVVRGKLGVLEILHKSGDQVIPQYDRLDRPCTDCKKL